MSRKTRLLGCFQRLSSSRRDALLEYAEFLLSREPATERPVPGLVAIPRPDEESVIAAIRRLSKTYPMLSGKALLDQTSSIMSEHLLHGRPAPDVIDRLEAFFQARYLEFLEQEKESFE